MYSHSHSSITAMPFSARSAVSSQIPFSGHSASHPDPRSSRLYQSLESVGLSHRYFSLIGKGLNDENFSSISLLDFDYYGITEPTERQKFFRLLLTQRSAAVPPVQPMKPVIQQLKQRIEYQTNKPKPATATVIEPMKQRNEIQAIPIRSNSTGASESHDLGLNSHMLSGAELLEKSKLIQQRLFVESMKISENQRNEERNQVEFALESDEEESASARESASPDQSDDLNESADSESLEAESHGVSIASEEIKLVGNPNFTLNNIFTEKEKPIQIPIKNNFVNENNTFSEANSASSVISVTAAIPTAVVKPAQVQSHTQNQPIVSNPSVSNAKPVIVSNSAAAPSAAAPSSSSSVNSVKDTNPNNASILIDEELLMAAAFQARMKAGAAEAKKSAAVESARPQSNSVESEAAAVKNIREKPTQPKLNNPSIAAVSAPIIKSKSMTIAANPDTAPQSNSSAHSKPAGTAAPIASKIQVAVRKRPINPKEKTRGESDIIYVPNQTTNNNDNNNNSSNLPNYPHLIVSESKEKFDLTKFTENHKFIFDKIYNENISNQIIYDELCKPLVEFVLNKKGKATCFAYGQTGSGVRNSTTRLSLKTYTMLGPSGGRSEHNGLYVLATRDLFNSLKLQPHFKANRIQIYVSFYEIYSGKLFDLLNNRNKLVSREDSKGSVNIIGLKENRVFNSSEVMECITNGNSIRSIGQTGANNDSSRSHAILQISIKKVVEKSFNNNQPKRLKVNQGKMSFIDLAGSEFGREVNVNDRRTRLEGAEINKSLLALKECIRALDQGGKHLPFRGSQLTQVLKDSFGSNSRTLMIANISPNEKSVEHTLNTLRYANRVKELKKSGGNDNGINENPALFDAYMPHQMKKLNKINQIHNSNENNINNENLDDNNDKDNEVIPKESKPKKKLQSTNLSKQREIQWESALSTPAASLSSLSLNSQLLKAASSASRWMENNKENEEFKENQNQFNETMESEGELINEIINKNDRNNNNNNNVLIDDDIDSDELLSFPSSNTAADPQSLAKSIETRRQHNQLKQSHHNLCSIILEEEEKLINNHRISLNRSEELLKMEFNILNKFNSLELTMDQYINEIENIQLQRAENIRLIQIQFKLFHQRLNEEEILSQTVASIQF